MFSTKRAMEIMQPWFSVKCMLFIAMTALMVMAGTNSASAISDPCYVVSYNFQPIDSTGQTYDPTGAYIATSGNYLQGTSGSTVGNSRYFQGPSGSYVVYSGDGVLRTLSNTADYAPFDVMNQGNVIYSNNQILYTRNQCAGETVPSNGIYNGFTYINRGIEEAVPYEDTSTTRDGTGTATASSVAYTQSLRSTFNLTDAWAGEVSNYGNQNNLQNNPPTPAMLQAAEAYYDGKYGIRSMPSIYIVHPQQRASGSVSGTYAGPSQWMLYGVGTPFCNPEKIGTDYDLATAPMVFNGIYCQTVAGFTPQATVTQTNLTVGSPDLTNATNGRSGGAAASINQVRPRYNAPGTGAQDLSGSDLTSGDAQ